MTSIDPSTAAYWSRAPQQRDDEAASFFIAPLREKFLQAAHEYVEAIERYDGLAISDADRAAINLLSMIADWEGDHVRREVLEID